MQTASLREPIEIQPEAMVAVVGKSPDQVIEEQLVEMQLGCSNVECGLYSEVEFVGGNEGLHSHTVNVGCMFDANCCKQDIPILLASRLAAIASTCIEAVTEGDARAEAVVAKERQATSNISPVQASILLKHANEEAARARDWTYSAARHKLQPILGGEVTYLPLQRV